jgi:pimeloyl-ACP methyl ester carboxylesterase
MNTTPITDRIPGTAFLTRPGGRIAYDIDGSGPLVVLIPGMGDLRATYRFLAPALREAGNRVATTDLRGHGESDTTFASYGDVETAEDIAALVTEVGGPAVLVGNSMGAGAAAIVAAEHPELVAGLVLVGPFVRNPHVSAAQRILMRAAMARPWVATVWNMYLPKLYAGQRPADFDSYRKEVVGNLRRPGHAAAFSRTTHTSHAPAEAKLGDISAAVLVVMGDKDPDFPDPQAEATWIAQTLHADVVMVPEAGHYPQSQQPAITAEAILAFLATVHGRA